MCLAQGPQRSDTGEARARGPLVSSQALYHWATALPKYPDEILIRLYTVYLDQNCFQGDIYKGVD